MEKSITLDYDDASSQGDENTSFLANNGESMKETVRRKSVKYLLLANLFVFTMSALTLVCAIYMQHSKATYTTAGLMDEFDLFCKLTWNKRIFDRSKTDNTTLYSAGRSYSRVPKIAIQATKPYQLFGLCGSWRRSR